MVLADLARACIPRSVTVALALPISAQLDAPAAITAAVVLTQVRAVMVTQHELGLSCAFACSLSLVIEARTISILLHSAASQASLPRFVSVKRK